MSDEQMEQEILERGLTNGPRISLAHVEAMMDRVQIVTVQPEDTTASFVHTFLDGKFALATGFTACVDPQNYDPEFGIKNAIKDAEQKTRDKLYELEGYRLFAEHFAPAELGMNFSRAFALMREGKAVARPHWGGYWVWDEMAQAIYMHCKDGDILEIRETVDLAYTLENILANDWIVIENVTQTDHYRMARA